MNLKPIYSEKAERALIGACVSIDGAADDVLAQLDPEDFFNASLSELLIVVRNLRNKAMPVDFSTITADMDREKSAMYAPLIGQLLCESPGSLPALKPFIKRVMGCSRLRKMQVVLRQGLYAIEERDDEPEEVLGEIEAAIFDATEKKTDPEIRDIDQVIVEVIDYIDAAIERKKKGVQNFYVTSGIPDLDYNLTGGGFKPGQFIVVAARPGKGKSIFAVQCARENAKIKKRVGLISMEMTDIENGIRMAAAESGISMSKIMDGDLGGEDVHGTKDRDKVAMSLDRLAGSNLKMITCSSLKASELRSKARRLRAKFKVDVILVDYIQKLKGDSKNKSRQVEIGEITGACKTIAMELGIPVVGLAQIKRTDGKPTINDLRESGDIEQDADIVALFWTKEQTPQQKLASEFPTDILLAKQRNGKTGDIPQLIEGRFCRFTAPRRDAK